MKRKRIYQLLGAAEFDNYRSTDIKTFDYTLKEEYQINLFKGVVYKLVFDVSKMPEGVIIRLHDLGKKRGAGKYEEVFNSETATKTKYDTYEITLEFPLRKMMVSYDIINNTKPGCVSFVLGYYFKNKIK
ncbi:MAG: hypothetical protein JKX68_10740 [Flavobacteriales bacterium]|nr:hypothetical protein [Flavobacteriales bacterium]